MKNVSNPDSDRGRFFIPLRVRDDSKFLNMLQKVDEKSKNEILKLKELPNERLEGSWVALWLGIRTFFGCKLSVVGLQGQKHVKIENLKLKELPNERLEGSWGAL